MPVILATREGEIRRIQVQSQPRKIVFNTLSQKYATHTHTHKHTQRVGGVTQVIEHPPNKRKALSLNPSTTPQKSKN
jgi:hypothetical protein